MAAADAIDARFAPVSLQSLHANPPAEPHFVSKILPHSAASYENSRLGLCGSGAESRPEWGLSIVGEAWSCPAGAGFFAADHLGGMGWRKPPPCPPPEYRWRELVGSICSWR